jgi:tetratricopeptide (TPR) repeat protein
MSRPVDARHAAEALLLTRAPALDRTYALHALGIIERDAGRAGNALKMFRAAISIAERAGLHEREVDLEASLGTALGLAGRRRAALAAFDRAMSKADGRFKPRVLVRRAAVLLFLDDAQGAYRDGHRAVESLRRLPDRVWEANARHNTALALMQLGRFADADRQFARAQELAEAAGEEYGATVTLQGRGDCAQRQGDLPRALELLYRARNRYQELGLVPPEIVRDLAVALLAAGLTEEATGAADELVDVLDADRASAGRRADGLIAAAIVHLDYGNAKRAIELARRAVRANHRQDNVEGERHSKLVLLKAQAATAG